MFRKAQLACLWSAIAACSWMALPQSDLPQAVSSATAATVRGGGYCAGDSGVGVGQYVCGYTFCWVGGWNDTLVVLPNGSGYLKKSQIYCPCSTQSFDVLDNTCDPSS